jgi:ABC-type dipeptide/oligopeptide/nickel transport system permease subunit
MAVAQTARPISLAGEPVKTVPQWLATWKQFSENKLAVLGLVVVIFIILLGVTADFWKRLGLIEEPSRQHAGSGMADAMSCATDNAPGKPQFCFIFGSDDLGRDMFSRTVYGTQVSLAVAVVGATVTMTLGVVLGLIAGYYGGTVDYLMMRLIDFLYGLPELVLIILMGVYFRELANYASQPEYRNSVGPIGLLAVDIDAKLGGLFFVFVVIGLLGWIGIARLTRGQVLSQKQKEFVEAARAIGARDRRIIFVHLLPNIVGPLIVIAALSVPGFIFTESVLSFLGLGVHPPIPSWGALIDFAYVNNFASHPLWILGPGGLLSLTVLAFTFLGDGLRDAFDPRLRGIR